MFSSASRWIRRVPALLPLVLIASCAAPRPSAQPPPPLPAIPEEMHLSGLRQLTFGGENAEAYWSFDGKWLSLQVRAPTESCDRIHRLRVDPGAEPSPLVPVSSGKGATTCAHFFPGDEELLYASTHLGSDACPPKPDMSQGYVWALYDTYDIFKAKADGTGVQRLTDAPGYDAEGTVCAKDGSIVFTSTRDGDIELYRMDRDGKNVKRLTSTPGYDGGAFFNADCSKLVWRASRPKAGPELEEFQGLLKKGLVRPTRLELFVANADGSDPRQVTYLGAASFAPFWVPGEDRIIFSTNYPDPRGREFDLWAINADGTGLERITWAKGFDGFPMFSPDGQWLAFSSNRATPEGRRDTNVFVVRWVKEGPASPTTAGAAERIKADVQWLAAPEREGRGVGTSGLAAAGAYLEERYRALGLSPDGEGGSFRQPFPVTTGVTLEPESFLKIDGQALGAGAYTPLGFSAQGTFKGPLAFAGYGIVDAELGVDDYKGVDVKGKIAVVRRFAPDLPSLDTTEKKRRAGDIRKKAFLARERGAVALVVVDWPLPPYPLPEGWAAPEDAALPPLVPEGAGGDAGLGVVVVKRAAMAPFADRLQGGKDAKGTRPLAAELRVALRFEKSEAFNVVARLKAPPGNGRPPLVIGAHYDHLGFGGRGSLAPDRHEPHVGADDNASGTAVLLEIARSLAAKRESLQRDVVFASFSGEESGVLGSDFMVRRRADLVAKGATMVNLDMVGRLRDNRLTVLGTDTAPEWAALLAESCAAAKIECNGSGDGYGPSDQMSFYAAGVPVLHLFTGAHGDYHKPFDTPDKLSYGGTARIAGMVEALATKLQATSPTYRQAAGPGPRGDARSFGASLGTVPNYGGPPPGTKGVLLDAVRPGGGADLGGMKRGDILVRLGTHEVGSVEDLMYVLQTAKPGETVTATVIREGQPLKLQVTFQEGRRMR